MTWLEKSVFIYLIGINVITFAIYGIDKWKARKNKWRISEAALLIWAFLGGSPGALLGMQIFRHKTKHWKFKILVPLFLILLAAAGIFVIYQCYL